MTLRLATLAAPVAGAIGFLATLAGPAEAGCWYNAWGHRVCHRPPVYAAPPLPRYYAPPRAYYAPPRAYYRPRAYYGPPRAYYRPGPVYRYRHNPVFHFGFGLTF